METATRKAILRAGVAAPSADNSQPWLFRWQGDQLHLGIDPSRSGGVSDARYVLSDLAIGACLENMLIQGAAQGYEAEITLFPSGNDLWPVRFDWRPAETADAALAEVIAERHTDRRFPWRGPCTAEDRARLAAQAQRADADIQWFTSKPDRRRALRILHQAEALRFKSPRLHAELFSTLRFDVGWRDSAQEGLPPAALAVESPARPLFQALRNPRFMAAFNRLGAASVLGLRSARLPARLSPGLCLLTVNGKRRRDVINAGRALERVWLQATRDGLALQPFAAAGVMALGFLRIEPALEPALGRLRGAMQALCPSAHGMLFLRMGRRASPVGARSGRRSLDTF